jgi:hypothetical protein
MSITFTINDNENYVNNNCPELVHREDYSCQCVDFAENGEAYPTCSLCDGIGSIAYEQYPFELNIANANARTLINALGLTFDYCGEIDPRTILKAVKRTPAALIEREGYESHTEGEPHMIAFGIHEDQAQSYLDRLAYIAQEAEKREEKIYWS